MDTKDTNVFEITIGVNDAPNVLKMLIQSNIKYSVAGLFVPSATEQVPSTVKEFEAQKPSPKPHKASNAKRVNKAVKAKPTIKVAKVTKTKKSGPSSKIRWTKKRSAEHGAKVKAGKALKKLNPDAKAA